MQLPTLGSTASEQVAPGPWPDGPAQTLGGWLFAWACWSLAYTPIPPPPSSPMPVSISVVSPFHAPMIVSASPATKGITAIIVVL